MDEHFPAFPSDVHPMGIIGRVSICAPPVKVWIWRFERRAVVPGFAPVLPVGHWKGGSWWIMVDHAGFCGDSGGT